MAEFYVVLLMVPIARAVPHKFKIPVLKARIKAKQKRRLQEEKPQPAMHHLCVDEA